MTVGKVDLSLRDAEIALDSHHSTVRGAIDFALGSTTVGSARKRRQSSDGLGWQKCRHRVESAYPTAFAPVLVAV